MTHNKIHRLIAGIVFILALVLFVSTVAPTASFWDASERIAVAHGLQVPHPPGAPFYMLLGRIFSMFVPVAYVALSINLISALASALTVMLAYLIVVRFIREWKGSPEGWSSGDRVIAFGGGIVGAFTVAVSDSFWFNAVEAETYATSTFFTALVVWMALKWSDRVRSIKANVSHARTFGSTAERWLVLIAFVYGIAIGVHLLSLLAIFFVGLIVYFTQFEEPQHSRRGRTIGIAVTGVVTALCFFAIYPGIIAYLPQIASASDFPALILIFVAGALLFGLYYTQNHRMRIANLVVLCATVVMIGYSSYALIMIRSIANPPIDQNNPENVDAFVSYMTREQYGERPLFRGATFDDRTGRINLDRETTFPRRWSGEPRHIQEYAQYNSDIDFFLRYQVGHMYVRYFMWNFVGRASDEQGAPAITGFRSGESDRYLYRSPSEEASRSYYFGLPLLLGLIGLGFHYVRDWRRAFSLTALFLVTGLGIILYLNQTPLQPRERDYSYAGSFFAFSLWVGIGAAGVLELLKDALMQSALKERFKSGLMYGAGGLLLLAVPGWMLYQNYPNHDRSGVYVPPEYAYNLLNSVEENAILFTNGDNDTFPLWYLQEVEGIRRDVRVANLSLLNTPWYIRQMTRQVRNSEPVPLEMTDAEISQMQVSRWDGGTISVPVRTEQIFGEMEHFIPAGDRDLVESPMQWEIQGRPYAEDFGILWIADQVVIEMVLENARRNWERPIYFATTVSRDNQVELDPFLQLEGMAYRVVPVRTPPNETRVVTDIMLDRLSRFRFTNLDNPNVYFDSEIRRMMDNYRNIYTTTARTLAEEGRTDEARALLDEIMERLPFETIPADAYSALMLASMYETLDRPDRALELVQYAEPAALHHMQRARSSPEINRAAQLVQFIQSSYLQNERYELASSFSQRIADILEDPTYHQTPEELRQQHQPEILPETPETEMFPDPG